jgi:hypothetical protein
MKIVPIGNILLSYITRKSITNNQIPLYAKLYNENFTKK